MRCPLHPLHTLCWHSSEVQYGQLSTLHPVCLCTSLYRRLPLRTTVTSHDLTQFADDTVFWFSSTQTRQLKPQPSFNKLPSLLLEVTDRPKPNSATSDSVLRVNSRYVSFRTIPITAPDFYPPQSEPIYA